MQQEKIIIIGAGMAGLTCARRLTYAGMDVRILDKGRGIGGRLATRRTDTGLTFDHGAQYVTARGPGFQRTVNGMLRDGFAGRSQRAITGRNRLLPHPPAAQTRHTR